VKGEPLCCPSNAQYYLQLRHYLNLDYLN